MKNSYFSFPYYTDGDFQFRDIFQTTRNKKLDTTFINNNPDYWYYKNIQDNTRLDVIAYKEYNDSSMWDILFYINQMDNIWDLPKSEDYINTLTEDKMREFDNLFGSDRIDETRTLRRAEIYKDLFSQNEKHRRFRFINKKYIPTLIATIKG